MVTHSGLHILCLRYIPLISFLVTHSGLQSHPELIPTLASHPQSFIIVNVEFGETMSIFQLVYKVGDERERICASDSVLV